MVLAASYCTARPPRPSRPVCQVMSRTAPARRALLRAALAPLLLAVCAAIFPSAAQAAHHAAAGNVDADAWGDTALWTAPSDGVLRGRFVAELSDDALVAVQTNDTLAAEVASFARERWRWCCVRVLRFVGVVTGRAGGCARCDDERPPDFRVAGGSGDGGVSGDGTAQSSLDQQPSGTTQGALGSGGSSGAGAALSPQAIKSSPEGAPAFIRRSGGAGGGGGDGALAFSGGGAGAPLAVFFDSFALLSEPSAGANDSAGGAKGVEDGAGGADGGATALPGQDVAVAFFEAVAAEAEAREGARAAMYAQAPPAAAPAPAPAEGPAPATTTENMNATDAAADVDDGEGEGADEAAKKEPKWCSTNLWKHFGGDAHEYGLWNLDRIGQPRLLKNGGGAYPLDGLYRSPGCSHGDGVDIYLLDTGVQRKHAAFQAFESMQPGYNAVEPGTEPLDEHGHGTHTAGTACGNGYGVAKRARCHPVKVLALNGGSPWSVIIAGIDWAIGHDNGGQPKVISLSLQGPRSEPAETAARRAVDAGAVVVVAAGNFAADACGSSPGAIGGFTDGIVTVGALDRRIQGEVAENSGNFDRAMFAMVSGFDAQQQPQQPDGASLSGFSHSPQATDAGAKKGGSAAVVQRPLAAIQGDTIAWYSNVRRRTP